MDFNQFAFFLKNSRAAKINTNTSGIENTSPFRVRRADMEKSANTWQNVFVTEAKSTELPTQERYEKLFGAERFMRYTESAKSGQPMTNSFVLGLAPETSDTKFLKAFSKGEILVMPLLVIYTKTAMTAIANISICENFIL